MRRQLGIRFRCSPRGHVVLPTSQPRRRKELRQNSRQGHHSRHLGQTTACVFPEGRRPQRTNGPGPVKSAQGRHLHRRRRRSTDRWRTKGLRHHSRSQGDRQRRIMAVLSPRARPNKKGTPFLPPACPVGPGHAAPRLGPARPADTPFSLVGRALRGSALA
jgi:hypothetical protein